MFDEKKARRVIRFIECLKHTKGEFHGKPFKLLPWQEKIIRDVFGTVRDEEPSMRQYKRPCRYPGCPNLCEKGIYCEEHSDYSADRLRGGAAARGYDARWRKARKAFLTRHPLCAECLKNGTLTPATVVDHIVPHRGDHALFWDEQNWQPLCKSCHDKKTGGGL